MSSRPGRGLKIAGKFGVMVSILVVVILVFWASIISSLVTQTLTRQVDRSGRETARALALLGERALRENKLPDESTLASLMSEETILAVEVINTDGERTRVGGELKMHRSLTRSTEAVTVTSGTVMKGLRTVPARIFSASIPGTPLDSRAAAIVAMDAGFTKTQILKLWQKMAVSGVVLVIIGAFMSMFASKTVTKPIKRLIEDMAIVGRGNLEHTASVASGDEIGWLAVEFNKMTRGLREGREVERERQRLENEVNAASEIQANLLPDRIPTAPGYDIYPYYRSAREVGGDYYDVFAMNRENLALVVADVSGKGIPGSMVMATTRTITRMVATETDDVATLVRRINELVAREITRGMFVTMLFAVLNTRTRKLKVCSAGHNPMVLFRSGENAVHLVNPSGIALGFDKGPVFNRTLGVEEIDLAQGDRVVLYTDGVVEAMDEQHREWGDDSLYEFTRQHSNKESKEFVHLLVKALDNHKGDAEQHDDITITTLRVL